MRTYITKAEQDRIAKREQRRDDLQAIADNPDHPDRFNALSKLEAMYEADLKREERAERHVQQAVQADQEAQEAAQTTPEAPTGMTEEEAAALLAELTEPAPVEWMCAKCGHPTGQISIPEPGERPHYCDRHVEVAL